jgi:hypothetical protein
MLMFQGKRIATGLSPTFFALLLLIFFGWLAIGIVSRHGFALGLLLQSLIIGNVESESAGSFCLACLLLFLLELLQLLGAQRRIAQLLTQLISFRFWWLLEWKWKRHFGERRRKKSQIGY